MRSAVLLTATMMTGLAAQAANACDYCERAVILTPPLAECYLAKVEAEIAQMVDSNLPAQLVNLASCEAAVSDTRAGAGLPELRSAEDPALAPSLTFLLDEAGMRCLARTLEAESWSPDTVKRFEVRRDCETR